MIRNNIKSNKTRGFTIVELLVVIVVIGILAAITIVSYTGISAKANTAKANTSAEAVKNVAEIYYSENSSYPITHAEFALTSAAKLPSAVVFSVVGGTGAKAAVSATNGTTTVSYQYCGAVAAPASGAAKGAKITFWDFSTSQLASANTVPTVYYLGTATAALGVGTGTECNTWVTPAS